MEQSDLLKRLCGLLERLGVRYIITGSQATIVFGEPRFTNDIDVVADLQPTNLDAFCDGFPAEDFYLSRPAAHEAVRSQGMFNIIQPKTGLKIDVIIPKSTVHEELRLSRGVRAPIDDEASAVFSSPEDIILKKLEWHEMGGGERHLRDIAGVIRVSGPRLDWEYLHQQARSLGVDQLWRELLAQIGEARQ